MALPLVGMADVLRAAGLAVVEHPGWRERTQKDGPFAPRAVMWHHDASGFGDSPGVPAMMANLNNNGAQCWVDRRGVWHLVAAGRMWHAGTGGGWGRIPAGAGNIYSLGVETDHTTGEDWPNVQVTSLRRGTAALLRWLGTSPYDSLCGHKEYRISNPDPDGLDMGHERQVVAGLIANPEEDDMALFDQATKTAYDDGYYKTLEIHNALVGIDGGKPTIQEHIEFVVNELDRRFKAEITTLRAQNTALAAAVGALAERSDLPLDEIEARVAKALRENTVRVEVSVSDQT